MVVISAAVLSKEKTLVARQFIGISKFRIESLLSAYLRLIESASKDYTYLETETVRYVYLPIKALYLVLVTNKQSNILEDLETLKLLQQVLQQCCGPSVDEDTVLTKAFDIVFAFDEVISFGYRETVTPSQVKVYTEMQSHDEKLSILVQEEKMREERKRGQKIATRLDKERKEQAKLEAAAERAAKHVTSAYANITMVPQEVETDVITDRNTMNIMMRSPGGPTLTGGTSKGMKLTKPNRRTGELLSSLNWK